jgi:ribosomal protein S18 acetylase RimI-like enzyme
LNVELRPMTAGDVKDVVRIHLDAFPRFFLSFLGARFLRELYRAIIGEADGISFVAIAEGRIIGFVAGTASASGFYRRAARQRWWRFGFASAGAFLRRPAILPRLLRALYAPPKSGSPDAALLMSLAVDPQVHRSGAGSALTAAFVSEAGRRGRKAVVLTTDREGNEAVNTFYVRNGFQLLRDFATPEGRAMNEYIRYI